MDILILVAVGTSEFPFDRLLGDIDVLCEEGVIDGSQVIAQIGCSGYRPRCYRAFSLIARDDYQKYVDEADFIITHAGTGSVIPSLKMGKKVIVFPRQKQYHEHVDDHQFELSDIFSRRGYVLAATNLDELRRAICEMDSFEPAPFVSNAERMNQLVIKGIYSLMNNG